MDQRLYYVTLYMSIKKMLDVNKAYDIKNTDENTSIDATCIFIQ
jgi:hypothetical protein